MKIAKPEKSEYNEFYQGYVDYTFHESDILGYLKAQRDEVMSLYESLPEEKLDHAYAEGKWTVEQLLRHIIDTERVFGYRAMCIARGDRTDLPGFDENDYVDQSDDSRNTRQDMLTEFIQVRNANMSMILNFSKEMLATVGNSNESPTSVRAIVYILGGHLAHHLTILKERYL
ncbi:hypothetical protein BFP72_06870 [Reichenbachiella sp. 5M10]|uniref:DinB family protein n=1 Tax=Reichenbachiella sp. 5M10 TaxID=1889772 RepID=UPI000C1542E3|nr:DinB family protein [Reichenbachiella sp. 5M10]PIB35136.1 hypothetical protein BFP72_06870 [Reichenbachiella sp. 5M10]